MPIDKVNMESEPSETPDSKRLSWISDTLRNSISWTDIGSTGDKMDADLEDDDEESQYSSLKKRHHDLNMSDSFSESESFNTHKHSRNDFNNGMNEWEKLAMRQKFELEQQPEIQLDPKYTLMDYIWKEQWAHAALRCKYYPVEANKWSEAKTSKGTILWRKLPIHAALKMGKFIDATYYELIKALFTVYPDSARCGDENGDLPLHIAAGCKNVSSPQLVEYIISRYPDALSRTNNRGMLPLHRAYAGGSPNEVLQVIYNRYPLAAQITDHRHKLPIEYKRSI